jgi:hypothetical protein
MSYYIEFSLYSRQTSTEKTIWNTMTWPHLTQHVEPLYSACHVCQLTVKEIYEFVSPKATNSDAWFLFFIDLACDFPSF